MSVHDETLNSSIFKDSLSTCPLVWMNHSYHCDCKVTEGSRILLSRDKFNIDFCNNSGCESLLKGFNPSLNIQLIPPNEVQVQKTPEGYNLTWKSGYESNYFLNNFIDFEILAQSLQRNEIKTDHLSSPVKSVSILFKSDSKYCVKLRSRPYLTIQEYKGVWSKWGPLTCWKNELPKDNENISVILTKSLAPVCVVVGVLLLVLFSPAARMKIKTLSHTPSPAPFFQPLFQQYEGSLQEWLSPQHKFALIYKTEEILTTTDVTVVPTTKDPEENQVFRNPPVTQLTFAQCPTSYVGLPGLHEVSPAVTFVCPGDTSYTQLPSSIWGLSTGEVQAISPPPKDFSEISCCDSGCSFETLTSLPTSPVEDSSPPFYCNDYCILNKTAEGVVPVLVSKGGRPNVPSDQHQKS
ncbi:hypothetical protein Q5P01_011652 [Channa striata]|uniref:Fibronectin type-III domain-containing protein n=1 Tax=Channa striata TaxID=64152 RepID=A0AA88STL7_CHASR|nr:hypothetical protein Q5P01_011652 [Channa striata]